MNEIRQHVPGFVDGVEPNVVAFDTLEQLLAIPFVKRWTDSERFYRLSVNDEVYLIAEFNGGREWWVVGYLRDPVPFLPEWDRGIYEVIGPNGALIEVPGRGVASSCAGEIRMKDGRILKSARWS